MSEINRQPRVGTFEVTLRCNFHCKMCMFRHADCENAAMKASELTAAEWIDMARQAAELGTLQLLVTGGEPMLRPDFCELWEGIYRQGFLTELYTNGSLVNDEIMRTLKKYPPNRIGVTLYGASAETYEKVCGNGALFEKSIAGFHRLQELPSKLDFRTTIIRDNYADLPAMDRIVGEEFGQPGKLEPPQLVSPAVRGACADVNTCRLDPESTILVPYFREIEKVKAKTGDSYDESRLVVLRRHHDAPVTGSDKPVRRKSDTVLGCEAGTTNYTITYDGRLQGCQMLGAFSTEARHQGLQAAWDQFPEHAEMPEWSTYNEKCRTCPDISECPRCPAGILAETGSFTGWPEYLCRYTRAKLAMYRDVRASDGRPLEAREAPGRE